MKNIGAFFDIDGTIYRDSLMVEHFKKLIKYEIVDQRAWVAHARDTFLDWDKRQGNYDDYLLEICDLYVHSLLNVDKNLVVHIETNGAIDILPFKEKYPNIIFILDYKLASSNMTHLMKLDNLNYVTNKDVYKFVLGSDEDLQEAYELITKFNFTNKCLVYFSPVFSAIKLEDIVEFMKEKNLNKVRLQVQLHKVIWDPNMKGV